MFKLPVTPLIVIALLVVALVVEALEVKKFAELPHNVEILAETAERELMKDVRNEAMLPVKLVTVVEARVVEPAIKLLEKILVDVEFEIVPLETLIEGRVKFVTERLVRVAEVIVALLEVRLIVFVLEALLVEAKIVVK